MSLSQNKSKKKQKNLRNVLVCSDKTFWPVISESDSLRINNKLKTSLAPVKKNVPRAPRRLLQSLSKEQKRNKHEELLRQQPPELIQAYNKAVELRKFLFLGVNSVCKGIEERKVASCILDADVSPRMLVSHVAELAKTAKVPVLVVTNLKNTIKSVLGFSSIALGFQNSVKEDSSHIFHDVCLCIIEIAKLIETTEEYKEELPHTNIFSQNKNEIIEEKVSMEINISEIMPQDKKCINITETLENIYLYRNSDNVRTFRPPSYDDEVELTSTNNNGDVEDCLELNTEEKLFDKVNVKKQRYFAPLVVNRVQGNPNKKKKKMLKKK